MASSFGPPLHGALMGGVLLVASSSRREFSWSTPLRDAAVTSPRKKAGARRARRGGRTPLAALTVRNFGSGIGDDPSHGLGSAGRARARRATRNSRKYVAALTRRSTLSLMKRFRPGVTPPSGIQCFFEVFECEKKARSAARASVAGLRSPARAVLSRDPRSGTTRSSRAARIIFGFSIPARPYPRYRAGQRNVVTTSASSGSPSTITWRYESELQ